MDETTERLRTEYLKRRDKNQTYSLRAFARDLGISHTYLSLVFSGKRKLSNTQVAQMGMLLGISGRELQSWISRSMKPSLKKKLSVESVKATTVEYKDLQIEYSKVLAGWYYLALMDATYLKGANNAPEWYAKRLKLNTLEVRDAIDRLKKLEMLDERDGKLYKSKDFIRLPTKKSQGSLRAYHQSAIQKALLELKKTADVDFLSRQISGGTVAISNSKISKARERLKQFQDEFIAEFASENADEVYQFNLQFFPLTQTPDTERK